MQFSYPARTVGSNFEPIVIEVKKEGVLLPALGVTVTVSVKDQDSRKAIVTDGVALSPSDGRWNYNFTPEQISCVCGNAVWLVTWKIVLGTYTHLTEPALLPVRKPV